MDQYSAWYHYPRVSIAIICRSKIQTSRYATITSNDKVKSAIWSLVSTSLRQRQRDCLEGGVRVPKYSPPVYFRRSLVLCSLTGSNGSNYYRIAYKHNKHTILVPCGHCRKYFFLQSLSNFLNFQFQGLKILIWKIVRVTQNRCFSRLIYVEAVVTY